MLLEERVPLSSHVRRLGGWVAHVSSAGHHAALHLGAHSRSHHASLVGSGRSGVVVHESALELDSLDVLLVFDLLLHVLVSLEQLVVLSLTELQSLVQIGLELLLESVHLVLLLLDQLGLGSDDLLVSFLEVSLPLLSLELLASNLDLVGLLVPGIS